MVGFGLRVGCGDRSGFGLRFLSVTNVSVFFSFRGFFSWLVGFKEGYAFVCCGFV